MLTHQEEEKRTKKESLPTHHVHFKDEEEKKIPTEQQ